MNQSAFESLLVIKLQDLLSFIKEKNGPFKVSIHWLYNSRVYEMLSNESSKLWQMSTPYLYQMLENEKNDNSV